MPGAKREVSSICLDPDGCMVRSSTGHYCFVTILYNETTGADARLGGDIMDLRCKKGKLFITGEVFPLDISLLMGAVCVTFEGTVGTTRCSIEITKGKSHNDSCYNTDSLVISVSYTKTDRIFTQHLVLMEVVGLMVKSYRRPCTLCQTLSE